MVSDIGIQSRINQQWKYSGIDTRESCLDRKHFDRYPYDIDYQYNSKGFRDREWPQDLSSAVWCVGDSFTVGIGSPIEHTWPWVLEQTIQQRTVNVSLDGGSNDWIARHIQIILDNVQPKTLVVMWSYINRREADVEKLVNEKWQQFYTDIKDSSWPECIDFESVNQLPDTITKEIVTHHLTDHNFFVSNSQGTITVRHNLILDEDRRLHFVGNIDHTQDIDNFQKCVEPFRSNNNTQIVHSVVPGWAPDDVFDQCCEIIKQCDYFVLPFERLDLARDGHHFDIDTSRYFCQLIVDQLDEKSS